MTHEQPPSEVPRESEDKQGGDIWDRWSWVSRAAWSSRMLAALENGVRGGIRWKNAYLDDLGLLNQTAAQARARQPRHG